MKYFILWVLVFILASCICKEIVLDGTEEMRIHHLFSEDRAYAYHGTGSWFKNGQKHIYTVDNDTFKIFDLISGSTNKIDLSKYGLNYKNVTGLNGHQALAINRANNTMAFIHTTGNEITLHRAPPLTVSNGYGHESAFPSAVFDVSIRPTFASTGLFVKDYVIIQIFPIGTHDIGGFYQLPNTLAFNILSKEFFQFGKYPSNYDWSQTWDAGAAMNNIVKNNRNQLIFSYPMSNYLYIYENLELIDSVYSPSQFLSYDIFPPNKPADSSGLEDLMVYYVEKPRFFNLKYDSNNDLYYRMAAHPISFFDENGEVQTFRQKPWSVMILDKDFNLLNEISFPPNVYDINYIIETDDGIWVKKNESDYYHLLQPKKQRCSK